MSKYKQYSTYLCPDGLMQNGNLAVTWRSDYLPQWLESQARISYVDEISRFRIYQDNRGYWTAQKKINNRVCKKRVGKNTKIDRHKLDEASKLFSQLSLT